MPHGDICGDYYYGFPFLPGRLRTAQCSEFSQRDRWVNFVYSLDLTPSPDDDDPASTQGAWSVWDLPVSVATQVDDERGDDLILVAIADRVYQLDWTRYRDEFNWGVFTPIFRRLVFGPVPYTEDEVRDDRDGWKLDHLKRFRELVFLLKDAPTDAGSKCRVSVQEINNDASARSGVRTTAQRNRVHVAVKGVAFDVALEHEANEDFRPLAWMAEWDTLGRRLKSNTVTTL